MLSKEDKKIVADEVLKLFQESSIGEVEKRFGNKYLLYFIFAIYLVFNVGCLIVIPRYVAVIFLVTTALFVAGVAFYIYFMRAKSLRGLNKKYRTLAERYSKNWLGVRMLIFFEKLQKNGYRIIDKDKIVELYRLEKEAEIKNDFQKILNELRSNGKLRLFFLTYDYIKFLLIGHRPNIEDLKLFVFRYNEISEGSSGMKIWDTPSADTEKIGKIKSLFCKLCK